MRLEKSEVNALCIHSCIYCVTIVKNQKACPEVGFPSDADDGLCWHLGRADSSEMDECRADCQPQLEGPLRLAPSGPEELPRKLPWGWVLGDT